MPTTKSDLVMLRRAIREGWLVPDSVRRAIIDELTAEISTSDVWRFLAVSKVFLAMRQANIDAWS